MNHVLSMLVKLSLAIQYGPSLRSGPNLIVLVKRLPTYTCNSRYQGIPTPLYTLSVTEEIPTLPLLCGGRPLIRICSRYQNSTVKDTNTPVYPGDTNTPVNTAERLHLFSISPTACAEPNTYSHSPVDRQQWSFDDRSVLMSQNTALNVPLKHCCHRSLISISNK